MAENDSTTPQGEQEAPGKPKNETYGFGPTTEAAVNEQVEMVMAFAFLGKRAFTDAGRDWDKYLSEIGCPLDEETLIERAFEGLLKAVSTAWHEMFEPRDSVKGQLIDRTKKAVLTGVNEQMDRAGNGASCSASSEGNKENAYTTPEGGEVKAEGREREYFTHANLAWTLLNGVMLNLKYIRALGDMLNECSGHNVELSPDTLTGIGGQVVDLVEQTIESLEMLLADAMDQADNQAA